MTRNNSNDDDPASAASDALSLHTIVDQVDAYEAQDQEDADFALALALEDEENQRLVQAPASNPPQSAHPYEDGRENEGEDEGEDGTRTFTPYRDDPDAESEVDIESESLPAPYYDDPNAISGDGGDTNHGAELTATPSRYRKCVRIFRKLGKAWLCCLGITTVVTFIIFGTLVVLLLKFGKQNPKDAAWKFSDSADYALNLPKLFPILEEGASEHCKTNWTELASAVKCHRMILSSAWDDGDADEVKAVEADPYAYSVEMCSGQCRSSIESLKTPLEHLCHQRTDRFDLTHYGNDGRAYFDKRKVEEGPVQAVESLLQRYDRLCAQPPKREAPSEWGTCAADLWMTWGVVDGKNEMNLNGLDTFIEKTNEKKTIPRAKQTGSIAIIGGKKFYDVDIPPRAVGPGLGETDCGYCTVDWLERKMRSFEHGEVFDPKTGKLLGLEQFNDRMTNALRRCRHGANKDGEALQRVKWQWMNYGWWCDNAPCQKDSDTTKETQQILHGVRGNDWPLPWIQSARESWDASKGALDALHDGLTSMPCSIWFNESVAINQVIPHQHMVARLCSDQCRNSVERIQQQHGREFPKGSGDTVVTRLFGAWDMARQQQERICLNQTPNNTIVRRYTDFCAPGYAALGHPEWTYPKKFLSRPEILEVFSEAIDQLDKKLDRYAPMPKIGSELPDVLMRVVAESLCNTCTGKIFIGQEPEWKTTVNEYLNDRSVDGREYIRVAKKGWMVCSRMFGHEPTWLEKKLLWKKTGLDRYD
jgi:hypothetical protein